MRRDFGDLCFQVFEEIKQNVVYHIYWRNLLLTSVLYKTIFYSSSSRYLVEYYYFYLSHPRIKIKSRLDKLYVFVRFCIRETGTRNLASNQDADVLLIGEVVRKQEHIHSCEQHQSHI